MVPLYKFTAKAAKLIPLALAGDPTALAALTAMGLLAAFLALKEKLGK